MYNNIHPGYFIDAKTRDPAAVLTKTHAVPFGLPSRKQAAAYGGSLLQRPERAATQPNPF